MSEIEFYSMNGIKFNRFILAILKFGQLSRFARYCVSDSDDLFLSESVFSR